MNRVFLTCLLSGLFLFELGCGNGRADSADRAKGENTSAEKPDVNIPITATDEDYCTILFSSRADETEGLYSIGSNGKDLKKLVSARVKSPARVSPRGKKFTFASYAEEHGGNCQAVYDSERDTLIFLGKPGELGWYPRWWDEDHIYYRSTGFIYKQDIHTGEHVKITKERLRKWLDPIWVPELKKFVNVEKRFIATFNMDGSGYSGDTLNIDHNTEYNTGYSPFLVSYNKKILIGFQTTWTPIKVGELRPPRKFVCIDLQGNINLEVTKIENGPVFNMNCDSEGNWIYFTEYLIGENRYEFLKRKKLSDSSSEQLIYYKQNDGFNNVSVHKGNIHE